MGSHDRLDRLTVLVGLHRLVLGGSMINAVDLAAELQSRGHRMVLFGMREPQSPMIDYAVRKGVELELIDRVRPHQLLTAVRWLNHLARKHGADVVHAYETYPPAMLSFWGPHAALGTPILFTIYAMAVPRILPRYPQLIVGTGEIADQARRRGVSGPVHLIEPPVDLSVDDPATVDGQSFRREWDVRDDELLIVVVSRLTRHMKLEGIERAVRAVAELPDAKLRFAVVGTGDAGDYLAGLAAEVNAKVGRESIFLTGPLLDPRPAYAAADIVLGMGLSALRGLAFGKPLIVLGEDGFSEIFAPDTTSHFFYYGMYGRGAPPSEAGTLLFSAADPLVDQLGVLASEPETRARLAVFSRRTAEERYSLTVAADQLECIYRDVLADRRTWPRWLAEAGHNAVSMGAAKSRWTIRRWRAAAKTGT